MPHQNGELGFIDVRGVHLEIIDRGSGPPLLFLHPSIGIDPAAAVLDHFGKAGMRVIAPSHPGFGHSDLPKSFNTVDDLAYFYLDLMDQLDLRDALVVGASFGAWIAAEIAIKSTARIGRLVLADAVGIRVSDRETSDIADMFAITEQNFVALAYHDPAKGTRDPDLPEEKVTVIARNKETTALYAWSPYFHDPKLKGRLHRLDVPTLMLWGDDDRIVTPDYGRAYAGMIPGAKFALIEQSGHFPHVEQPEAFARNVLAFAGKK